MIVESKPVLLVQPDFADAPVIAGARKASLVAISPARRIAAYTGLAPQHVLNQRFVLRGSDLTDLEDHHYAVRGKWLPFWALSWHQELVATATLASGGTNLSVSPVNYASVYNPADPDTTRLGHYIFLLDIRGNLHVTKVNSVSGSNPEVLALATAPGVTFTLGDFIVGFLYHVRFVNDDLSLEYFGPNEATAQVSMIETFTAASSADVP